MGRQKRHRCVQALGLREPGAELPRGQKRKQARTLQEPPANRGYPAWLEYASRLPLALGKRCQEAALRCRESIPCALPLYLLNLPRLAADFRC